MLFAHVHLDSRPNRFFCDPKKLVSNCLADVSVTAIPTRPRWHTSDQNSLVTFERHRGRTVGGFSLLTDNHFTLFSRETSLSLGLGGLIGYDDNYTSEDCKWAGAAESRSPLELTGWRTGFAIRWSPLWPKVMPRVRFPFRRSAQPVC